MKNRAAPAPTALVSPTPVEPPPPSGAVAEGTPEPRAPAVEPPAAEMTPPSAPVALAPEPPKDEARHLKPPPRKTGGKMRREINPEPEPVKNMVAVQPPPEPTKPTVMEDGSVEFRVRPFGAVWVDGKFLGETPFAPAGLEVGRHQVRIVIKELGREVTMSYDVKSGSNVFRYNFDE
jgi:serine/threonine-protein kinase